MRNLTVVILIFLLIGFGAFFFFFRIRSHKLSSPPISPTPSSVNTLDMAPSLPMREKTTLLLRLNDSSEEKVILPTVGVQGYLSHLPSGVQVLSQSP